MTTYTTADYTRALDSHEGRQGGFVGYQAVVASALRIASRVARVAKPGYLEAVLVASRFTETPSVEGSAATIRRALTEVPHV